MTKAGFEEDVRKRRAVEAHSRQADQFAGSYGQLRVDPFQTCFLYSRYRLHSWLRRLVPIAGPGETALDVGCGTGHHLRWLDERGFRTAGVDGSGEMLAHAQESAPQAVLVRADVDALPFPDAAFEVVLCLEVLRYLADPSRCLAEIRRVLRPGGACVLTATPRWNLNGYWAVNRLANRLRLPGFVRLEQFFTTARELRVGLARAGLARPEVHGVYLGPVNWVERLIPSALPALLRRWEPLDSRLSDRSWARDVANMYVVRATREA